MVGGKAVCLQMEKNRMESGERGKKRINGKKEGRKNTNQRRVKRKEGCRPTADTPAPGRSDQGWSYGL